MKKLFISALFVMQVFFVFAQNISGISGKVVDAKTQKPLQNAIASIQNSNLSDWEDMMEVNLTAPYRLLREISKIMIENTD